MTRINQRLTPSQPLSEVKPAKTEPYVPPADPVNQVAELQDEQQRKRDTGRFPALSPADGSRAIYDNVPSVSARDLQRGVTPVAEKPDLSGAMVFGRPVETSSSHDLFWHYFGGRPSPTNNDEARAMMAEMADKFAPFGMKVEPIEHARMDKVRISYADGKEQIVDFIYAMGAEPGVQRLQWLGDAPATPGQVGRVDSTFISGLLTMYPPTNDGIKKALEEIKKQKGYEDTKILEHPLRLDKLQFPNGDVVDVIIGAGGPNPSWGWLPE